MIKSLRHLSQKRFRAIFFLILCAACLTGQGAAYAEEGLALQDAVRIGLETNPALGGAASRHIAAGEVAAQAQALYLPSLDMRAEAGPEFTSTPVIAQDEMARRRVSLTLTQLLFDGFGTTSQIRREKARAESARQRAVESSEDVALNIIGSFLDILRRRELLASAEKNIFKHQDVFEKIRGGADSGKFNQGDVAQVEARLDLSKANLESVRRNLSDAETAYAHAVGQAPPGLSMPVFDRSLLPENLDDLLARTKAGSPALARVQSDVDVAQASHDAAGSGRYPTLKLQLENSDGYDMDGIRGRSRSGTALVVMNWNLFRGGADQARTREALYQEAAARYDAQDAERALEQDVRDTWEARDSAARQLAAFNRQAAANAKVVAAYQDQFSVNRRSLVDLLDAQNALYVSESNRISAFYSELFANYRLLALGGRLLKALDVEKASPVGKKDELVARVSGKAAAGERKLLSSISLTETRVEVPGIPGGRYVQLGSYRGQDTAEEDWAELVEEYGSFLKGVDKKLVRSDMGKKGVYYRLLAGPLTEEAAKVLCDKVNAQQAGGCFIVAE